MALFPFLLLLARSFFAPRLELMAEILALRQQLAILNRTAKRPSLRFQDRLFWIALSRFWRDWRSALLIVKPETVIKWQLAFNLVAWFKRLILPAEFLTATIKTLRHRVFNLAGKIVTKSRQLFLVITDEYRFQDVGPVCSTTYRSCGSKLIRRFKLLDVKPAHRRFTSGP